MTLHGLRQLIEWSIQHACMEKEEKVKVLADWQSMWFAFCKRIADGEFKIEVDADSVAAAGDVGLNRPAAGAR